MMRESDFQGSFIKRLKETFPGCVVLKNDPNYIQGIPDLIVLYGNTWAALEVKKSKDAPLRPNQKHYIQKLNEMSFAEFLYPENADSVFRELEEYFYGY